MPKRRRVPKYSLHKPTGQARVQFDGRTVYLGKFNSPESRVRYEELVAELQATPETKADSASLTVGALCVAYVGHCRTYYRKNGAVTSEVGCVQQALRPLVKLYSSTLVAQFSPVCLNRVREEMIRMGWVRTSINRQVIRIRKMFKWAIATEAIRSPEVLVRLKTLDGLQKGRSKAEEAVPVNPVKRSDVEALEAFLPTAVWAMVRLQLATGMRPGEVRVLKLTDIDRTGDVWEYRPVIHKNEHRNIDRVIFIGVEGQRILQPWINAHPDEFVFQTGTGRNYTKDSYCRSVSRACIRAGIESWSPNQLRHTAATDIRKRFGLEASRVVLGHAKADTTQVYAERDFEAARTVARQMG